jgi:hypothetical protein
MRKKIKVEDIPPLVNPLEPTGDYQWKFFTKEEMRCKGSGEYGPKLSRSEVLAKGDTPYLAPSMDERFMRRLDMLRERYGMPIFVTSGFRSPRYNAQISRTGASGPHTTGHAVDIRVAGNDALDLIALAVGLGFTGVGVKQHGTGRFLHLDDLPGGPGRPRPWIWSYT